MYSGMNIIYWQNMTGFTINSIQLDLSSYSGKLAASSILLKAKNQKPCDLQMDLVLLLESINFSAQAPKFVIVILFSAESEASAPGQFNSGCTTGWKRV